PPPPAQPFGHAEHRAAEILGGGGQRVAERVERQQRRLRGDGRRHRIEREIGDEAGQTTGGAEGGHGDVYLRATAEDVNSCAAARSPRTGSAGPTPPSRASPATRHRP